MNHPRLAGVLTQLRQAVDAHGGGPTDAELLDRFVANRDHAAFELLVWRHGAMVLQTCRRLLARAEDAEDAFQATFLALVRRAKSIKRGQVVAGWLHTVACRVALRARAAAARRADRERQATAAINGHGPAIDNNGFDPVVWAEVRNLIDQELSRLSAKLRDPFVLCCLEGLTNEEAAGQLGCPTGTVLSRLSRARERLRGRLIGRGLGLPAAALTAALGQEASACLAPAPLVISTVKAAALVAAGQATASVVSAPVAALTEGVLKAMFLTKLKMVAATVVLVGGAVAGSGGLVHLSSATAQVAQKEPPAKGQPAAKPEFERRGGEKGIDQDKATVLEAEQRVKTAELQIKKLEDQLVQLKQELSVLKDIQGEAHRRLEVELRIQGVGSPPKAEPKPNAPQTPPAKQPPQSPPAVVERVTFPVGASTDLIQLATAYVDSLRDLETAKARAAPPVGTISREETAMRAINVKAAERKADLLRAIAEAALRGADSELRFVRTRHNMGDPKGSVEQVNAAQTKVEVLKLILGSAK